MLHTMLVEIDGSCGVFRVGRVSVGEDMVDDFVLESGKLYLDKSWDVIGKCCRRNEWFAGFGERLDT